MLLSGSDVRHQKNMNFKEVRSKNAFTINLVEGFNTEGFYSPELNLHR